MKIDTNSIVDYLNIIFHTNGIHRHQFLTGIFKRILYIIISNISDSVTNRGFKTTFHRLVFAH